MSFLTSDQLKQYKEEGYVAPIEVLSKEEAKEVRDEIELIEKKWPNELEGLGRNYIHLISPVFDKVCNNTKIITQRAIMGANITDSKAFNLYTANGGTTGKYSVSWNEDENRCFAEFTVKPLEGTSDSVIVKGEALGFLKTSIDTRVYFIKNF